MKIYLSPSDQSDNITATGSTEARQCGDIARQCAKILNSRGHVTLVGDNTKRKSYIQRVKESNSMQADLHICIHTNAGGGQGTLVMCSPKSKDNQYVQSVYKSVASLTPTNDLGIQVRQNLYEINATNAVCIYIEVEFHDNLKTQEWIEQNIDKIALAIADGISPASDEIVYKVQVGAFKDRQNALAMQAKLHSIGFDAIVKEERKG